MQRERPMIGFVHINKTGGTSVKFILRNSLGIHHCDVVSRNADGALSAQELAFAKRCHPGLHSIAGHPLRAPSLRLPAGIRYFTFIRDPVERAASQFQQIGRGPFERRRKYRDAGGRHLPSIEEFTSDPRWRNLQTQRIAGCEDFARARREIESHYFLVGLTARFLDSIRLLARLSPHPIELRYRRLKVAPDDSVKRRLLGDPALRKLLEQANEVDQALYEWVRDVRYPAQREQAGDLSDLEPREVSRAPLRYRLCRLWNNAVYKQAVLRLMPAFIARPPHP